MSVDQLSPRIQDAVKVIWALAAAHPHDAGGVVVQPGQLAAALNQKPSATSEIIRRLVDLGLVTSQPYAGVALTPAGNKAAVAMIRRHRIIEMFLATTLNYGWEEVHREAENLEHAVSDTFVERLDQFLGRPQRDPHGYPIPTADGSIPPLPAQTLADVAPNTTVIIDRISDSDPQLLTYLAATGVVPGAQATVLQPPYPGVVVVAVQNNQPATLSVASAHALYVAEATAANS